MIRVDDLKKKLEARRSRMGDASFSHVARQLSSSAQNVLCLVLGGSSLDGIEDDVVTRDFHHGHVRRPSDEEIGAARAKVRLLLGEIAVCFQLVRQTTTQEWCRRAWPSASKTRFVMQEIPRLARRFIPGSTIARTRNANGGDAQPRQG